MPHIPAFLPPDLHIVSQAELLLLERGAVARGGRPPDGGAGGVARGRAFIGGRVHAG